MAYRRDWAFTEDGDLNLGHAKVNEDNETLYLHQDGTIDTEEGEDGKKIRDIARISGYDVDKQVILNRLRTESPDWYHHPKMGGNLSDLIGEPNTRKTAEIGIDYIIKALTYGGLYDRNSIQVRPLPVNPKEILFIISIIKAGKKQYEIPLILNLEHGAINEYGM